MGDITIEVNGVRYTQFTTARVTRQIDTLAGDFSFNATVNGSTPIPFKQDDKCKIFVEGVLFLTGYIEIINVNYSADSHTISIEGRSYTADIIDSSIDAIEFKPPITLTQVIERVINHIGSDIKVISNVDGLEAFNSAEDILSPEVGDNAFNYIEKLARKRQVLLTTDEESNLTIVRSGTNKAPTNLQHIIDNNNNNILSASVSYDNTSRFNKYIVKSQLNLTAANFSGISDITEVSEQKSEPYIDNRVRSSRQHVLQAENSSSDKQSLERAKWEANVRKARSLVYSATTNIKSVDGLLWLPNQVVHVIDDFAGIDTDLLLNTVTYEISEDSYTSNLAFVDIESYTLELNTPKKGAKIGEGFIPEFN